MNCTSKNTQDATIEAGSNSANSDDSLLNLVQYQTFQYFWEGAEPTSGMGREMLHMDNIYSNQPPEIITSGGSGFGLMVILVGVEDSTRPPARPMSIS